MFSRILRKTAADSSLIEKPELAPHFEFRPIDDRQVFLVSENFNTLLHGRIHPDLLPLLDGRHSVREIVSALNGAHSEAAVTSAILSLSRKGYVVSGEYAMDRGRAAFFSSLGVSPRWAEERLAAATVTVLGPWLATCRAPGGDGRGRGRGRGRNRACAFGHCLR